MITRKNEASQDRRIQRTRGLLRGALLAMIVERDYDSLRIEDITERANLRRATFYMHYRDKQELLLDALAETFAALASATEHVMASDSIGGKTQREAYRVIFAHVAEHHVLYRNTLNGQSGAFIAKYIRGYLAGFIQRGLDAVPPENLQVPADILSKHIAGAELALITSWLED